MPGVAAEIGLDQGLGDARDRGALDRQREARDEQLEGGEVGVGKAARPIGRPGRVGAVHGADCGIGAEAVDHRDIVGHALAAQLLHHRELQIVTVEALAKGGRAALVELVEGALQPLVGAVLGIQAAVLGLGRRRGIAAPFEHPPFQHRVQGVDPDHRPAQRQPEAPGALAELLQQGKLAPTCQTGGSDPRDQRHKAFVVHAGRKAWGDRPPVYRRQDRSLKHAPAILDEAPPTTLREAPTEREEQILKPLNLNDLLGSFGFRALPAWAVRQPAPGVEARSECTPD